MEGDVRLQRKDALLVTTICTGMHRTEGFLSSGDCAARIKPTALTHRGLGCAGAGWSPGTA